MESSRGVSKDSSKRVPKDFPEKSSERISTDFPNEVPIESSKGVSKENPTKECQNSPRILSETPIKESQ